jgi:hypothetical protein
MDFKCWRFLGYSTTTNELRCENSRNVGELYCKECREFLAKQKAAERADAQRFVGAPLAGDTIPVSNRPGVMTREYYKKFTLDDCLNLQKMAERFAEDQQKEEAPKTSVAGAIAKALGL